MKGVRGTAKGEVRNPTGINQHVSASGTWQSYGKRAKKWLEMPMEELAERIAVPRELSSIDEICIKNIISSGDEKNTDRIKYLKFLIDRVDGKVTEKRSVRVSQGPLIVDLSVDGESFGDDFEDSEDDLEDNE